MPDPYTRLLPGSEIAREAAAQRCLAELDAFLTEFESSKRALVPDARCAEWRSAAASNYEGRLDVLRDRLDTAGHLLTGAREALQRQVHLLSAIAEMEDGRAWRTS